MGFDLYTKFLGSNWTKIPHTTSNNGISNIDTTVSSGTPLYKITDLMKALNPIAKLIRMIFIDNKITDHDFDAAFKDAGYIEGKLPKDVAKAKNNALKALSRDRLSVTQFERILHKLGFKIVDIRYTLQNVRTGEVKEYTLSNFNTFIAGDSNNGKSS